MHIESGRGFRNFGFFYRLNETVSHNVAEMLISLRNVRKQEVYYRWNLIEQDKDDNKFIDCAVACNADLPGHDYEMSNMLKFYDSR